MKGSRDQNVCQTNLCNAEFVGQFSQEYIRKRVGGQTDRIVFPITNTISYMQQKRMIPQHPIAIDHFHALSRCSSTKFARTPGSIPRLCGLSLLILYSAPIGFTLSWKTNIHEHLTWFGLIDNFSWQCSNYCSSARTTRLSILSHSLGTSRAQNAIRETKIYLFWELIFEQVQFQEPEKLSNYKVSWLEKFWFWRFRPFYYRDFRHYLSILVWYLGQC